jgi:hypothetical protein
MFKTGPMIHKPQTTNYLTKEEEKKKNRGKNKTKKKVPT